MAEEGTGGAGSIEIPQPLIISNPKDGVLAISNASSKEGACANIAIQLFANTNLVGADSNKAAKDAINNAKIIWNTMPSSWRKAILPDGADSGKI